jgi:hypothetical protein
MKYFLIMMITVLICTLIFLGMYYLVQPTELKDSKQSEVTQLDEVRVLDIKKLIPHHDITAFNKIKKMPMIPLEDNLLDIRIEKTAVKSTQFKLPIKTDFNKTECHYCHTN